MSTATPNRYSPLWVTLHWLTAILIFAAIYFGVSSADSPAAEKASFLRWHMPIGATIFVLTLIRLFVRWRAPRPAPATVGNALLDKIGEWVHYLLYAFALLLPFTGMGLSIAYNLPPAVFEGQGEIPAGLNAGLHGLFGWLLTLLLLLHIGAALYHQFIRRDNLLARMWYGK